MYEELIDDGYKSDMEFHIVDEQTRKTEEREKLFRQTTSLCSSQDYTPDDGKRDGIAQAFAFTIPMEYYTSSSQTFGDVKQGCARSDQFMRMTMVFFHLCEALQKNLDYPMPQPSASTSQETDDAEKASTLTGKRPRTIANSKSGDDVNMEGYTNTEERTSRNARSKRRRRFLHGLGAEEEPLAKETASDTTTSTQREEVHKIVRDSFKSREEFRRSVQIYSCIEYVPYEVTNSRQAYARFISNHEMMGDIFDNSDPYRHFRNLFTQPNAACYTFHVLVRSPVNFNHALNQLLCNNIQVNDSSVESTVFVNRARILAHDMVPEEDLVVPPSTSSSSTSSKERTQTSNEPKKTTMVISHRSGGGRLINTLRNRLQKQHIYPWLKLYVTTPTNWLSMVDNYLHGSALPQLSAAHAIALLPYTVESPLNAQSVFSIANALLVRPLASSLGQRLSDYSSSARVYFQYNRITRRSRQRQQEESNEEYESSWEAPFPKRILWLHPSLLKPSNMYATRFPERDVLGRNIFESVYPAFFDGVEGATTEMRISNNDDDETKNQSLAQSCTTAIPLPHVAGKTYENLAHLERLIQRSKIYYSIDRSSPDGNGESAPNTDGQIFSCSELCIAIAEYARYTTKLQQQQEWKTAYELALRKAIHPNSIGVADMYALMPTEARVQLVTKPHTQISLEEYYNDPFLSDARYEQINKLYQTNKLLQQRLYDYLESPNTTLLPIDKECMVRIYETHVAKQYELTARSADSEVPQVSREINRYVEEKGMFLSAKRVRNLHILAPDLDPLSNFLIWCLNNYKVTLDIALCNVLLLVWLCSLDASRCDSRLKLNLLIAGEGGISKSHIVRKLEKELRIPKTSREETNNTNAAYNTDSGASANFETRIIHEASKERLVGKQEDGKGQPTLKDALDSQCVTTLAAVIDPRTGKVKNQIRFNQQIGVSILCTNIDINKLDESVLSRFWAIRFFQNPDIANSMFSESNKRPCDGIFVSELQWVHHFIQAVNHEIQMLIGVRTFPPPNTALINVVVYHINHRLKANGHKGFRPRDILKLNAIASLLCVVDIIVTEFLYPGGRYYHEDVTTERLASLALCMFVKKHHVVQAVKMMTQYAFVHGENAVRSALCKIASERKIAMKDVSVMYAVNAGAASGRRYQYSRQDSYSRTPATRERMPYLRGDMMPIGADHFNGVGEFSNNSSMYSDRDNSSSSMSMHFRSLDTNNSSDSTDNTARDRDWNYHFFRSDSARNKSLYMQIAAIATEQFGKSLTEDIVRMIVTDLSKRLIKSPRYTKSVNDDPTDEPRPRIWLPGTKCPCSTINHATTAPKKEVFCELHSKVDEMIAKIGDDGIYFSTAWLNQKEGKSVEEVVDDTLVDLFSRRHQEPCKTIGEASFKYHGTFNTFRTKRHKGHRDDREILQIPNVSAITKIEHAILHSATRIYSQSPYDDMCHQYEEANKLDAAFWTAKEIRINLDLNTWAALARGKELYRTGAKISFRQMLKSFYTFGSKVPGLIDSRSILHMHPFDPNDPRLEQYDDELDIDRLDEKLVVPESFKTGALSDSGDSSVMIPFSQVFQDLTNIDGESGFRRLYVCYLDMLILMHARHDRGANFIKYPDDIRKEMDSRATVSSGISRNENETGLLEHSLPIGQVLGLSNDAQQEVMTCTRSMAAARQQLMRDLLRSSRKPGSKKKKKSSTQSSMIADNDGSVLEDIVLPADSGSVRETQQELERRESQAKDIAAARAQPTAFMAEWLRR